MEREERKGEQMSGRGEKEVMRSGRGQDTRGEGRRTEKGKSEEGEVRSKKTESRTYIREQELISPNISWI